MDEPLGVSCCFTKMPLQLKSQPQCHWSHPDVRALLLAMQAPPVCTQVIAWLDDPELLQRAEAEAAKRARRWPPWRSRMCPR